MAGPEERDGAPESLAAAIRAARAEVAERAQALGDLREAELARLALLRELLEPVLAAVPAEVTTVCSISFDSLSLSRMSVTSASRRRLVSLSMVAAYSLRSLSVATLRSPASTRERVASRPFWAKVSLTC